jgi:hypothetical protein
MEYLIVTTKAEFDQFLLRHPIEVRVLLGWHERGDYNTGDLVEVWYNGKGSGNPCVIGKIIQDLGVVEPVWEDNNYHGFRVVRETE